MRYKIGDKIIFNKKYEKNKYGTYVAPGVKGWIEEELIGKVATITAIERTINGVYFYYIDIPDTHGYREGYFSKANILLVEV